MQRIRNIAITLGILIVCLAIGYYVAFALPKMNEQKFVMEQQQKCHDIGEKAYQADLKQYGVSALEEPQYGYSKKLNTCIYASGYHDYGSPSSGVGGDIIKHNCDANWEEWVKNSYTNEKIIEISNFMGPDCEWFTSGDAILKFSEQSDALFSS